MDPETRLGGTHGLGDALDEGLKAWDLFNDGADGADDFVAEGEDRVYLRNCLLWVEIGKAGETDGGGVWLLLGFGRRGLDGG